MTELPQHITTYFFEVIIGNISIDDFEKWIYANAELESLISPDDYLDLISMNYKASGAKYELYQLLNRHIDLGEFETYKMLKLLNAALSKDEKLPYYLMDFYDLYCRGYGFLDNLGLGYGLSVEVPPKEYPSDTWNGLTPNQQKRLLESFSPELEIELQRVKNWLTLGKIVLTGEQDDLRHFDWKDNRTEYEQRSIRWEQIKKHDKN